VVLGLRLRPPDACVVDGIQVSTGCTLGKGNIEVEEGDGISALFSARDGGVRISIRASVYEKIVYGLQGVVDGFGWSPASVEDLVEDITSFRMTICSKSLKRPVRLLELLSPP